MLDLRFDLRLLLPCAIDTTRDIAMSDAASTTQGKRKIILVIMAVLVVLGVVMFPFIWTLQAKQRIVATLVKNHGDKYAILGLRVNAEDARSQFNFNMYERLFAYMKYLWSHEEHEKFSSWHHCVILVSDNERVYRYYWSIRENRLILDAQGPIPVENNLLYLFDENIIEHRNGIRFKRHVLETDVNWYFPVN